MNNTGSESDKEWYEYIDSLVERFQGGEEECGEQLITIFYPFFSKYFNILKDGKLNLSDRDARKFIGLFISDKEIAGKLNKHYQSAEVRNVAYRTASYISQSCNSLDDDDIRQEMYVAFFTMARRWVNKSNKANFCGYIYNSFRYELQRSIASIMRNPIVNSGNVIIHYNDDENTNSEYEGLYDINTEETMMVSFGNTLDNNWVRGLTCSEQFLDLTALDRMILNDYYGNELSDRKIAEKTGLHINTINRRRHTAVEILSKHYGGEED